MTKSKKRRRRRRRRHGGRVLLVLLCLILLLFAAAALYYNSLLNRLSFDRGQNTAGNTVASSSGESTVAPPVNTPILSDEIPWISSGNKAVGEVKKEKNVVNVLLIGSDYRIPNTSDPGRADVTMLCSLN